MPDDRRCSCVSRMHELTSLNYGSGVLRGGNIPSCCCWICTLCNKRIHLPSLSLVTSNTYATHQFHLLTHRNTYVHAQVHPRPYKNVFVSAIGPLRMNVKHLLVKHYAYSTAHYHVPSLPSAVSVHVSLLHISPVKCTSSSGLYIHGVRYRAASTCRATPPVRIWQTETGCEPQGYASRHVLDNEGALCSASRWSK